MCNHCHNHGAGEESKNQVRRGFVAELDETTEEIKESMMEGE